MLKMIVWNPWHGCKKVSAGCENCYMYRRDESVGKDSSIITQTRDFNLPVMRNRQKVYKITSLDSPVYVCLTSDFFIEEADKWRASAWKLIRSRKDLSFKIITKRIERFREELPEDWGGGYDHVTIICTCENQHTADKRLPVLLSMPIAHREIIHEPMLERIDIRSYLSTGKIESVTCGGESGDNARMCDYSWILDTRQQCIENNVSFCFKQTGAVFRKDGRLYNIPRKLQMVQAEKAGIDFTPVHAPEDFEDDYKSEFIQLSKSEFRCRFRLDPETAEYCREKGEDEIRRHAFDIIRKRLAPAVIPNDGKQTPMKGHPVFVAQHATACCCRKCLYKWYHIPENRRLDEREINYIVGLIMAWIKRQLEYDSYFRDMTDAEK